MHMAVSNFLCIVQHVILHFVFLWLRALRLPFFLYIPLPQGSEPRLPSIYFLVVVVFAVCCLGFGCGLDCGLDTLVKYFHSSKTLVAGHVYRQDSFVSFSRGIVHKCTPNLSHRERRD